MSINHSPLGGPMDRRGFLWRSAVGVLGLSLARCATHEVTPLVPGVALPFLTPTAEHYSKNGAEGSLAGWSMPDIAPEAWSLDIDGLVGEPLTLTLDHLRAEGARAVEIVKTMQCVVDASAGQGLVGTARWRGVPLSVFLDRAGVDRSRAKRLHLFGADGFTNNLRLDRIYGLDPADGVVEPLLVTHMNGEPLARKHGAPVRLIVHDGFGYSAVKWLVRIEATADDAPFGTYQETGFTDEARSPVFSRVTTPTDNLSVPAGAVEITGFATSGAEGIEAVEVRVDGGPWQPATLADREAVLRSHPELAGTAQFAAPERFVWPFRAVWALWSFTWQATPGRHRIEVRAIDRTGATQPERDSDISDGVNAVAAIRVGVNG